MSYRIPSRRQLCRALGNLYGAVHEPVPGLLICWGDESKAQILGMGTRG